MVDGQFSCRQGTLRAEWQPVTSGCIKRRQHYLCMHDMNLKHHASDGQARSISAWGRTRNAGGVW